MSVFLAKFLSCSGEVLEILGYAHLSDWIAEGSRLRCRSCTCSAERSGQVALYCSARPAAPRPGKSESGPGGGRGTHHQGRARGGYDREPCARLQSAALLPPARLPLGLLEEVVRSERFPEFPGSRAGRRQAPEHRVPGHPAPAAKMLGLLVASLALALAFFALLDGWYLVRVPCAVLRARLLQPRVRDLLAEQRYAGRVLPSDLDLLLHMNNARYLREADVARAAHLTRCGVLGALRDLGAHTVLAASCARYRRSLRLFEPFEVRTRLLGWDDRAFYLEARFVSLRDGFLCTLLRSRQHVLGTSPDRVVQHLCKRRVSSPTPMPLPCATPSPLPRGKPLLSPGTGLASEEHFATFPLCPHYL